MHRAVATAARYVQTHRDRTWPPAFGIGGFADKFHSLHTYGLAVDITGIGAAGTPDPLLWHEIFAQNSQNS
jgi:hypothetical protein